MWGEATCQRAKKSWTIGGFFYRSVDQIVLQSQRHGFDATGDSQLGKNAADVRLDGRAIGLNHLRSQKYSDYANLDG